jgi:hypothetical protein
MINIQNTKHHNPLTKLAIWICFNILGQIIDIVESGLLINADPSNCYIVPTSTTYNSIVMLIFVVFTVYIQYVFTLWFFYDTLRNRIISVDDKLSKLLIESHDYS